MRQESDQAARALAEQARALKEMTSATQNTSSQIKLITRANREHSTVAGALLDQLRDIRKITDRNARDVSETRGNTAELIKHAADLAGLVGRGDQRHSATWPTAADDAAADRHLHDRHGSRRHELGRGPRGDDRHRRSSGDRPAACRGRARSRDARAPGGGPRAARIGRHAGPRAGAARPLHPLSAGHAIRALRRACSSAS